MRRICGWLVVLLVVSGTGSVTHAGKRAERVLQFDSEVTAGDRLVIENLIGSMRVLGSMDNRLKIEARVVTEAKTQEEADRLADGIRLGHRRDDAGLGIHVDYPLDEHQAFRLPRSERDGFLNRWLLPILSRKAVPVDYAGHRVEIRPGKHVAAVSVKLTVRLPYDLEASFRQAVGGFEATALRGQLTADVDEGRLVVDQSYGRLTARSAAAEIAVRKFRGDELEVRSVDGAIELNEIHAVHSRVESTTATVRGDGITGERFEVRTASGNLSLRGVDPAILALGSDSGKIDVATRLKRTREADIHAASGDVTLRVGELAYFDLEAESKSVKSWGLELEALTADGSQTHHRRGTGGAALRIRSGGELTVRPYDGSRLGAILQAD